MKRLMVAFSLIFFVIGLFVVFSYYQNNTIEKAVKNQEDLEGWGLIEKVPFADGVVAIAEDQGLLGSAYFEKSLLGWKRVASSQHVPLQEEGMRNDSFAFFVLNGQTFLWGDVPHDSNVAEVSFSQDGRSYSTTATSSVWHISLPFEINGFDPEQFAVTTSSGEEVSYPFNGE
ncbi:hypothetical protein [Planococcus lenghuensis]|uniref:Uncharacterized protein n=1 Tax=Planococcus lenghuensis TaxID=2213202 RepID=A0A1Q2KV11_9BACL|nr:hypothetical protein [Planococcus lenghuensis]AQQ52055.1 hypothetical protein B0X71_02235 [Planococcus lenghuensis]